MTNLWVWRFMATTLAVGWMAYLFYLSSLPPENLPEQQVGALSKFVGLRDVVGHFALYGILGSLLWLTVWSWVGQTATRLKAMVLTLLLGVLYGVSDEMHQLFTPGRSASLLDVGVDSAGVLLSVSLWAAVFRFAVFSRPIKARGVWRT